MYLSQGQWATRDLYRLGSSNYVPRIYPPNIEITLPKLNLEVPQNQAYLLVNIYNNDLKFSGVPLSIDNEICHPRSPIASLFAVICLLA